MEECHIMDINEILELSNYRVRNVFIKAVKTIEKH